MEEENIPVAVCYAYHRRTSILFTIPPGGIWDLVVICCPFCGHEHTHGGGKGKEPDLGRPRGIEGLRDAHCGRGTYRLVWYDSNNPKARPRKVKA